MGVEFYSAVKQYKQQRAGKDKNMRRDENEIRVLIDEAIAGNNQSLEKLLDSVQDIVFNLSLRMLGTVQDAEDAAQEILIRIMTHLSSFRRESSFRTWVYRLAVNYLKNYKRSMFAGQPLDFEYYGNDIRYADMGSIDDLVDDISRETLAEELKMCCTNVMLQCLDPESRCIFIFGTMFKLDSHTAGEILDLTPENYRKKLSRIRKKVAAFLDVHCGLTEKGICSCSRRVNYAISQRRINPEKLDYLKLQTMDQEVSKEFMDEMEKLDALALTFEMLPSYQSPVRAQDVVCKILQSASFKKIQEL